MADGYVSQVQLPNNETYDIKDKNAVKDITSSDIPGNINFTKDEETKDILVKDFGTAYGIDCYKGRFPLDFTSPSGAIDEWKIYGNSSGHTEVLETQSTLPVSIDTYGGNAEDWKIYGNNNPVVENKTGDLPIEVSATEGNAVDWEISGNDESYNLFDIETVRFKYADVTIAIKDNSTGTLQCSCDGTYAYSQVNYSTNFENGKAYTISCTNELANTKGAYFAIIRADTLTAMVKISLSTIGQKSATFTYSDRDFPQGAIAVFVLATTATASEINVTNMMITLGSTAPDHYIPYQKGVGERTANKMPSPANGTYTNNRATVTVTDGVYHIVQTEGSGDSNVDIDIPEFEVLDSGYLILLNDSIVANAAISFKYNGTQIIYYTFSSINRVAVIDNTALAGKKVNQIRINTSGSGSMDFTIAPMITNSNTYTSYIPYGYRIPLQIKQDATTKTADIYIGSSPLTQGQSITKAQSNVDLELFSGDNIIDTSLYNKPNTSITYNSSVLGVGENTEITGDLPIDFRSNGDDLLGYRIYGTADGAGVQTENLYDKDARDTENGYVNPGRLSWNGNVSTTPIANSDVSVSEYINIEELIEYTICDYYSTASYGGCFYDKDKVYISGFAYNNVNHGTTTITSPINAKYMRFSVASYIGENQYKMMLVKGSTPPETYIPYGYKISLAVASGTESKDTDIYIGDTKLAAEDYVDYESGKICKAKRIHEDTVTIDGIVWDILDYDHDEVYKSDGTRAKHTVTIQTHDIIDNLQYSARQAVFAFPDGLAAGTYHFTVGAHPWVARDVGKVLTFTIANAIPAGGQLVFNGAYNKTLVGTTISVFASPTSTTAAETVTMTEGDTGTDLGTILRSKTDAINSIDRALLGSNNWIESAMRQYLNSDKAAGSVWTPQSVFDRPPTWAATTAGFLHGIDPDFVAVLGNVKKTTGLNTISDGGGTAVHDEKFFLLSRSEVYMGDEYTGGEDTPYAYYKNYSDNQSASTGADKNRIKYRAGAAKYWWLRSPNASFASNVRLVTPSGAWDNHRATYANGVAPACCIVLDDMDDWVRQTFYTEVDADLPAIETFNGENTLDSTETLGEVTIKGYRIPLQIKQGATTKTVDIYIGSTPLTEGQSVTKVSSGTDIALYQGENTISTTLGNKPEMRIDYLSTVVGVGERTVNLFSGKGVTVNIGAPSAKQFQDSNIQVSPGEKYYINASSALYSRLGFYMDNARKSSSAWTTNQSSITVPDGCNNAYVEVRNYAYDVITDEQLATATEIMLTEGSTAPTTYIPYGYQLPIDIKQDDEVVDHKDIYIGTQPLIEGDYINQTGVYRRLHQFVNYTSSSSLPNYNFIPITEQLIAGNGENTITTSLINNTTIDVELHPTKHASWICNKLEDLQRRIDNVDSTLGAPERRNYLVTWCSEDRLTGSTTNLDFSFNNKDNGYSTFLIDGKSTATSAFIETIDLLHMINGTAQPDSNNYTIARPGKYVIVIFGVGMENSSFNTITLKIIRDNVVIASQQLVNEYIGCIPFEIPNDIFGNNTIIQIEVNSTTGWTDLSFGVGIAVLNATMLLQDSNLKTDTMAIGNFSMYDSYVQLLRSHRNLEDKCTILENKCTVLENECDQLANESVKDITVYSDYTSTIPSGLNIDISQYKNKIKYVDIYFTDNNYRKGEVYPYNILAENFGYLRIPYGQIYTGASADEATRLSLSLIGDENSYYIRRELFYVSTDYEQEHLFFSQYSSIPGLILQFVGTPTNDWSDFSVKGKASEVIKIYEVHLIVSS